MFSQAEAVKILPASEMHNSADTEKRQTPGSLLIHHVLWTSSILTSVFWTSSLEPLHPNFMQQKERNTASYLFTCPLNVPILDNAQQA